MRIAIISDIHGNCVALDAVLADLARDPYDQLVCLGDAVQGGSQPAQTVGRLRELRCPIVMGNADAFLLYGDAADVREPTTDRQRAVRDWSLAQLSPEDLDFMQSFQPTIEIPLSGDRGLLCFHGSPQSYDDLIFPETSEESVRDMLIDWLPHILTGGHTHLQQIRRIGDSFFFNPGSVGLAFDRSQSGDDFRNDPWAEYAMLDVDAGNVRLEFRRVPFQVERLVQLTLASGQSFAEEIADRYQPVP